MRQKFQIPLESYLINGHCCTARRASSTPRGPRQTTEFRTSRPQIVGPDSPESPFPILLSGPVQKGFGRGGKELGCPTGLNIGSPLELKSMIHSSSQSSRRVYHAYKSCPPKDGKTELCQDDIRVHPMVMSLGWNPFYKNEVLTAEIHIMHEFRSDFYGYNMNAVVLGYIRPELDYTSREALIEDIEVDKRVALNSLTRPAYAKYKEDLHFDLSCSINP
ncbi:Flavokinase domain-containing protein [Mycena sanguinolenta]|uniref:Riboflavin kinase n=1 Tax=Mycena sanguinolenta TaxID=230812 RepID=A0A8H7D0N3_9AGAR|nr:Flavokinase domain-containing protein [Mycena sanguinolenta]